MTDTMTPNYTKEEIEEATAELESMSPEDLLYMKTELQIAQDAINIPEAPAIAFLELRGTSGSKVNLTVRAINGKQALDALAQAVVYARERFSMTPAGVPQSNAPLPTNEPAMPMISSDEPPLPTDDGAVYITSPSPAPTVAAPQSTGGTSDIQVTSISREKKRDGKGDFLRVRGGKYVKFGVPCYPEYFPQGLDINKMQYGVDFTTIPVQWKFATVTDDKPYRVIAFHA